MTEKQDVKATRKLGTSQWSYVGDSHTGKFKIYETNNNELFAIGENDFISFEVYERDGTFSVY